MIKMKLTDAFKDSKGRVIMDTDAITPVTPELILTKYAFDLLPSVAAKIMHKSDMFVRCGLRCGNLPFGVAVKCDGGQYSYNIPGNKFLDYLGVAIEM